MEGQDIEWDGKEIRWITKQHVVLLQGVSRLVSASVVTYRVKLRRLGPCGCVACRLRNFFSVGHPLRFHPHLRRRNILTWEKNTGGGKSDHSRDRFARSIQGSQKTRLKGGHPEIIVQMRVGQHGLLDPRARTLCNFTLGIRESATAVKRGVSGLHHILS